MNKLERLTTQYVEAEDRIWVSGELVNGNVLVLWLTRRLLDRLIPHLVRWLEQQSGDLPQRDILLEFAQQAAQNQLAPQPAVQIADESRQWLVMKVDLSPDKTQMQLVFQGPAGQAAGITFAPTTLRQWMGIVYRVYAMADWPLEVWPVWVGGQEASPERRSALH